MSESYYEFVQQSLVKLQELSLLYLQQLQKQMKHIIYLQLLEYKAI